MTCLIAKIKKGVAFVQCIGLVAIMTHVRNWIGVMIATGPVSQDIGQKPHQIKT